jgi:alpha/beta hydrolase fold
MPMLPLLARYRTCVCALLLTVLFAEPTLSVGEDSRRPKSSSNVYPIKEGFIDVNGLFLYYTEIGHGEPLVVLHGGPGGSHNYFLPFLLPLARNNRLIFMDERGSGRSSKLQHPSGYTVDNMAADVEALRTALRLGSINF